MGGTVSHAHLHQGIVSSHCAGVPNLTDDPAGRQGASVGCGVQPGCRGAPARPPGPHSLLGTDVLALHGAAQHLAHTHAQPHVLKAQAQVLARDGEPRASLPRACLREQLRRGRGWDTGAVRSGLSRAGRGGGRGAGAGGQSTLRILGSVQRLLPWRACIQAAGESAGQWGRREQRRSATHQPHSKRGSALRHRPQLSRRAGHLYRWAVGRDAVSSARPRPPQPQAPCPAHPGCSEGCR